jgi:hypothetical protein
LNKLPESLHVWLLWKKQSRLVEIASAMATGCSTAKTSKASRRFRDIASAIACDLGGSGRLSEGERQLIRRCAMISVECEKMETKSVAGEDINLDLFGTLNDRLGRTLARLGLRRVPKVVETPSLSEYVAETCGNHEGDGQDEAVAAEDADGDP